ncbi:MAG: hypothetical protein GKR89_05245 [Candidatus Latescibacteria bacterium]|nr:hypothetical protein [Candidatus Latescibacterota bacterium]
MNLFIDTNTILSFYHFTDDDLESLRKLPVLLNQSHIKLFVPEQVQSEYERNREIKIADALKQLRSASLPKQFPQICRGFSEYDTARKALRELDEARSKLVEKIQKAAIDKSLTADTVIQGLFFAAKSIPVSDETYQFASRRHAVGDPPGKRDSLGDAINWECLLQEVPQNEDLHFITEDKDYASPLAEDRFNSFLTAEWQRRKGGQIQFYRRLSMFLKDHFSDVRLASEFEKEVLIQDFVTSSNFRRTRNTLRSLRKYFDSLTPAQLNDIVQAAVTNNQIYWIIGDADIGELLSSMTEGRTEDIDPLALWKLNCYLGGEDPAEVALRLQPAAGNTSPADDSDSSPF